jgi:hypothetical protein
MRDGRGGQGGWVHNGPLQYIKGVVLVGKLQGGGQTRRES